MAQAQQQFQDYQKRWLPLQDHLSDTVLSMGKPDSWQRQEAEGKGNEDAASAISTAMRQRTSGEMNRGINPGSSAFKLGASSLASTEAQAKGAAIEEGNQAIDKAYLGGLTAISKAGEGLAGMAAQGAGIAGQVGSREAISQAQASNASEASKLGAVGFGIGALSQSGIGGSSTPDNSFGFNPATGIGGGMDYSAPGVQAPAGLGAGQ